MQRCARPSKVPVKFVMRLIAMAVELRVCGGLMYHSVLEITRVGMANGVYVLRARRGVVVQKVQVQTTLKVALGDYMEVVSKKAIYKSI